MAFTYATQIRKAQVASGTVRHDVITTITDKGDLPDPGAFLLEIIEPDDPKRDALARVCGPGDFTTFGVNRLTAVRTNKGFYRASVATLFEADIIDANNAALQLQDELNRLVTDYQFYLGEFYTGDAGESLFFPQPNMGLLTPLVSEYETTVENRKAQEILLGEKQAECSENAAALSAAQTLEASAEGILDGLNRALSALNSALAALLAAQVSNNALSPRVAGVLQEWANQRGDVAAGPQAALDNFLLNPSGMLYDEYTTGFVPAQTTLASDIASITAEISAVQTEISAQQTRVTDAAQAREVAQTTSAECAAEVDQINSVLTTLKNREATLLAEIVALCPSWTPS